MDVWQAAKLLVEMNDQIVPEMKRSQRPNQEKPNRYSYQDCANSTNQMTSRLHAFNLQSSQLKLEAGQEQGTIYDLPNQREVLRNSEACRLPKGEGFPI